MPPTDEKESAPVVDNPVPVGEAPPLLLVDLPLTVIKGTITMMKQTALALVLGAAMAVTVPVIASEEVKQAVASEESSWKDKLAGVWEATREKTSTVFNKDEKLKMYQEQIKILEQKNAELSGDLRMHRIEVGVKHESMASCARDVADYLTNLTAEGK